MSPEGCGYLIRPAVPADLPSLVALEQHAFAFDRISARSFRRLLRTPTAVLLAAARGEELDGYALGLLRHNSAVARLYSIAVGPHAGGQGIGRALLDGIEEAVRARGCARLRLEVDPRNGRARKIYADRGYRHVCTLDDYYQDGGQALRLERIIG